MSIDVDAIKQGQKQMWSIGDYPELAQTIQVASDTLVQLAGVQAGEQVLDVATGSGNAAIAAARVGASVTGLDLTPQLLEVAKARVAQEGLSVRFVEGDAEALPFDDGAFDRVTSCFGVMFAPRHDVAAGELVRVARAGATIAFAAWTPEGLNGQMFKTVGSYMPPPPPELQPPVLWGTEEHVRSLFAHTDAEIEFDRRSVTFLHDSPESWVEYNSRVLGPAIMAKNALEPQGRWDDLRGDLVALYTSHNEAQDGTLRAQAEYLLSVVRLPA